MQMESGVNKDFRDIDEVYEALLKENVKGELKKEKDFLVWTLPNQIIIEIALNLPYEGYIGTAYIINGKRWELAHWHPQVDEMYNDLLDIQNGNTIWVTRKNMFGKKSVPIIMEKRDYEAMSDKRKSRYSILM